MNKLMIRAAKSRQAMKDLRGRGFRRALREDGAIDLASIMVGVLVIGIVGGVIAATVFAVIPWSQDQAAQQALGAVATAESVSYSFASADGNAVYASFADLTAPTDGTDPLLQDSDNIAIVLDATSHSYTAYSKSATGKIFEIVSTNPATVTPAPAGDIVNNVYTPAP